MFLVMKKVGAAGSGDLAPPLLKKGILKTEKMKKGVLYECYF